MGGWAPVGLVEIFEALDVQKLTEEASLLMWNLWGSVTVRIKNCHQMRRLFDVLVPERDADLSVRLLKLLRRTSP